MNGLQIKKEIDFRNKLIEEALTPNVFTLNNTVAGLLKEISKLQEQCPHEWDNGYCIYCNKQKESE